MEVKVDGYDTDDSLFKVNGKNSYIQSNKLKINTFKYRQ